MAVPPPYVGPRAFQRGERLYGRDREVMELVDLLIAERILLLHSPSGAGKTSLIQAALIPELEAEGFGVLPVMRVGIDPPQPSGQSPSPSAGHPAQKPPNRYILSVLLSLEESLPEEEQTPLEELATLSLGDYLDRQDAKDNTVLVFDQFEEILTLDPTDWPAKEAFFEQVGQVLRDRRRWALFAMREEYLAGLKPYLRPVPTRLGSTYRLELLGIEAARQAIQEPAREAGVEFTTAAAAKLVDELRRVRVQRADGTVAEQPGLHIEPVQLQVVCRQLWDKLPPGATEIVAADVEAVGDVNRALSVYYAQQVAAIADQTDLRERAIRDWVDGQLITEQGIRGQVLQGPERSQGLENSAIWLLVDAHLVRAEKRRGATWFELAHDRLIEPVRAQNAAWREAHLSALQRQAALWEDQGQPGGLLLRDEALVEAEAWASSHQDAMTGLERQFLEDCRQARATAERERRQARRIRRLAIGATILALVAIVMAVVAGTQTRSARSAATAESQAKRTALAEEQRANQERDRAVTAVAIADAEEQRADQERDRAVAAAGTAEAERQRAEEQSLLAQSRQVAAVARSELDRGNGERALLLAIGAYRTAPTIEAEDMLYQALAAWRGRVVMSGHEDRVSGCGFSPDGRMVVTLSGGVVHLWELGEELRTLTLRGHQETIIGMSLSPDGRHVITVGRDNTGLLWEVESGEQIWQIAFDDTPSSLAFSPDGKHVAVGSQDTRITVWLVESGTPVTTLEHDGWGFPYSIAYSPDGRSLAAAYSDGLGQVWRGEATVLLVGHTDAVGAIAFSPDGQTVATIGDDQTIRLWDPETGEQILWTDDFENSMGALVFSPDGRYIATASWNGSAYLWNLHEPDRKTGVLAGHTAPVASVAFSPDGGSLATASWDGTARTWHVDWRMLQTVFSGHSDSVWSAVFSPDGQYLLTASVDGTARLWSVNEGAEVATLRGGPIGRLVTFGEEGQSVLSVHDGVVSLWNPDTGEQTEIAIDRVSLQAAAVSADGALLAVAGDGGGASLWSLVEGEARATASIENGGPVSALAFDPDGQYLALGGRDGAVGLWDARSVTEEAILAGHRNDVYAAAFSPDGTTLATGGGDGVVRLWDWQQGETRQTWEGTGLPIWAVAFSPDGQRLAAADDDGDLWIWNLTQDGALERSLHNDSRVRTLAFSPDGSMLAAGAQDGIAYLWKWQAGEVLHVPGHYGWITGIAFRPDGAYMATTGHDGTVRIWPSDAETTISLACSRVWQDLAEEDWHQEVGEIEYQTLCPQTTRRSWAQADRLTPPQVPPSEPSVAPAVELPIVFYFEAIPGTHVTLGESIVLRWDLVGAHGAYLFVGDADEEGQGIAAPGQMTIQPSETTIYRLRAVNPSGYTEKVLRIVVHEP